MPVKNTQGVVIGVVQLVNKLDGTAFNKNDENFFEVWKDRFSVSYAAMLMRTLIFIRAIRVYWI